MRRFAGAAFVVGAFAAACSSGATAPPPNGIDTPLPFPFDASTGPGQRDAGGCPETVETFCRENVYAQFCADWDQASRSADFCGEVSDQPCAGFNNLLVQNGDRPPQAFYDAKTGKLVAILVREGSSFASCMAGPLPGFQDPLVVNCLPPSHYACGGLDAGADAPIDAPDAD